MIMAISSPAYCRSGNNIWYSNIDQIAPFIFVLYYSLTILKSNSTKMIPESVRVIDRTGEKH